MQLGVNESWRPDSSWSSWDGRDHATDLLHRGEAVRWNKNQQFRKRNTIVHIHKYIQIHTDKNGAGEGGRDTG